MMQKLRIWSWRMRPEIYCPAMPAITGWFDPGPHEGGGGRGKGRGGFLRLAANSYLAAKGDPQVRLAGLRHGDLVTLEGGRVVSVNGIKDPTPAALTDRPEFTKLSAVHPNRPLLLEST